MKWLLGLLAVFAGLFTFRQDKWAKKAVENEEDDVQNDLHQAEIANELAAKHDKKAHEIKAEAEKDAPKESNSTLLNRWRRG
jgi:hypothetical protein